MSTENRKLSPAELLAELSASRQERPASQASSSSAARTGAAEGEQHVAPAPAARETRADYQNTGRGAVRKMKQTPDLEMLAGHEHLTDLFDRVNDLLGDLDKDDNEPFRPRLPETLEEARLTEEDVERLGDEVAVAAGLRHRPRN